jgi:D-hexose-6-phosphate mutarotase
MRHCLFAGLFGAQLRRSAPAHGFARVAHIHLA